MTRAAVPCRSCGAPVIWAVHAKTDKPAPLDAEPAEGGNCRLADDGTYTVLGRVPQASGLLGEPELRTNHFQTCPDAERWKRGKSASKKRPWSSTTRR